MTDSEWTARTIGRPDIKAFNNKTAHRFINEPPAKGSRNRVALPVFDNDTRSKEIVMGIVDQIGFDPCDAGALSESCRYQSGTLAYCLDPTVDHSPPCSNAPTGL
jgi:predicted dinucleotide-binding enzyme